MDEVQYIIPKKDEFVDLTFISLVLGFLFSFSFFRFTTESFNFIGIFLSFTLFIYFLLFSKLIFMKMVALKNAFEISLHMTYFNQYWFNNWNKITYHITKINSKKSFKGIPVLVISIFLYFITLGFLVFPSVWSYKIKRIDSLFLGSRQKYENEMGHMENLDISNYRYSKALFAGFLFYFVFGIFLKLFFSIINESYYNWFTFILYWFAFWNILPIFGTPGYELFFRNRIAWIISLTILGLGMLALLIFNSLFYIIIVSVIAIFLVLIVIFWKILM